MQFFAKCCIKKSYEKYAESKKVSVTMSYTASLRI